MHDIQRHILQTLTFRAPLRYAKLKPAGVEGNRFMYHLHKLVNDSLVVQKRGEYSLTNKGLRFIEPLYHGTFAPAIQPTVAALIACRNRHGQWLLYRRKRQPFPGRIGFPYGKFHLGETVLQAAQRELKKKTGLSASLVHRGDAYVTIYRDGELLNQHLFHIFEGKNPKGEIIENPIIGKCFWANVRQFKTSDFLPGFREIVKLIDKRSRTRFFAEYVYRE